MKNYVLKIKHIVPCYFFIIFCNVIGLSLFRWLFSIQFQIININEEIWNLFIPIVLPIISILVWLRPRLRVLRFKNSDNGQFGFQVIALFFMVPVLIISQSYLSTATGKLLHLYSIKEISSSAKVKYYKLDKFAVATHFAGTYTSYSTSGRYNEHFNFDIYFVTPILVDSAIKLESIPKYWYGVKYSKQISNGKSAQEKEEIYKEFYQESLAKMIKYPFYLLDHIERTPKSSDLKNYLLAIEGSTQQSAGNDCVILEPVFDKYANRNGNILFWIFGSFGIGIVFLMFALIWPNYSESEKERFTKGIKPRRDELSIFVNYFVPKGTHFVSSIIADLNILVFLIMFFSGVGVFSINARDLLEWGANRRYDTIGQNEWWRLITNIFIHGGIFHLIMNISGLAIAAFLIEPVLGRKKYIALYILSGFCASISSVLWYANAISAGASGAIFGLFGGVFALLLLKKFNSINTDFLFTSTVIYVIVNLLWGLIGGVDNAAHIGGLISGFLITLLLNELEEDDVI